MNDPARPGIERIRLSSAVFTLLAYATVLVAFFLRAYRLADQNVWWDEGWSVWLSQKDLAWIAFRTAMDEHPPLHYWMLHFWNFIAGTNVLAGRFVSLAFGVLTIALLYRLAKRVGGAWVGILAALFLAIARFHIWWSQDIKNYTPSIFFAFAAVWFALQILDVRHQTSDAPTRFPPPAARPALLGYALCAALAMWTHYLAALVLLALNLYWLFVILRSSFVFRRSLSFLAHWLIANFFAALLFAPWLYMYLQNAAEWSAAPTFDFAIFLKLVATVLPLGVTTNIDNYATLTIAFTTILAIGCLGIWQRTLFRPTLLFALIIVFPAILIYLLSLTPVSFFAPKIQARYLVILVPAYTILLALGIALLRRFSIWLAIATTVFILGASVFVLTDYYAERRLRDEYTTLANTINAFARQGDLVLLDTDQEWPTFLYYLRYPLDWLGVPNGKAMTADDADALVRRALNRNDAVWLVVIPDALATDPQKLLEVRLARDLLKRFEQTFDDKRLVLYASDARDLVNVAPENFAPQYSRATTIDTNLTLLGFDLPVRQVRAGETMRVVTYWRATSTSAAQVAVRGQSFAQQQGVRIDAGERVRVQIDFTLPPMSADDLTISAHGVELARVRVEPRRTQAFTGDITQRVDYRLGDSIRLVGYDVQSLKLKPNETLNLKLFWRAEKPIEKSYTVFVHIVGEQFNPKQSNPLWGQVDRVPQVPTTAWLPNEIVSDTFRVLIDADAPPGNYQIEIGMYDAATGVRLTTHNGNSITIAEIEIVR